ncbi:MAG: hypothetical protein IJ220_03955 [Clostridia bacterium]|nr:hypothetical protein [Clostridia bacterium]
MNKEKNLKNFVLLVQIILTLCGTILSVVLLFRELKTPSLLGILGSATHLVTYLAIILYTIKNYHKEDNIYFQGVIYAYAAVMGIQILQAGNYISDFGLSPNNVLLINCCNLICFANIIKFADNLDSQKIALSYISIAVVLKLIIEICLIVRMFAFIQLIHVLMSLSIPILGITIIVAYVYRMKRMK